MVRADPSAMAAPSPAWPRCWVGLWGQPVQQTPLHPLPCLSPGSITVHTLVPAHVPALVEAGAEALGAGLTCPPASGPALGSPNLVNSTPKRCLLTLRGKEDLDSEPSQWCQQSPHSIRRDAAPLHFQDWSPDTKRH